jgi:hypothetical protein
MTRDRVGGEKQILSAFLDQQRDVVLWKLDGLIDDQLHEPIFPSGLYLLGLVKHLATSEYYWLCDLFGRPSEPRSLAASDDVQLDPGDTIDSVLGCRVNLPRTRGTPRRVPSEGDSMLIAKDPAFMEIRENWALGPSYWTGTGWTGTGWVTIFD